MAKARATGHRTRLGIGFMGLLGAALAGRVQQGAATTVEGTGEVSDGHVVLRIEDADGTELLGREFEGDFTLDETAMRGDAGTWPIDATRHGDDLAGDEFQGEYAFRLDFGDEIPTGPGPAALK